MGGFAALEYTGKITSLHPNCKASSDEKIALKKGEAEIEQERSCGAIPLGARAGDLLIRSFFRSPKRGGDEQHHAERDRHVRDVENRGAKIADAEIEEVDHPSVAEDPVDEIAHAAGEDEAEREQMEAIPIIRAHDINKQQGQTNARAEDKENRANVLRQLGAQTEGDAGVLSIVKAQEIGEEGLRTAVLQKGFGKVLGHLITADTSDRGEKKNDEFGWYFHILGD